MKAITKKGTLELGEYLGEKLTIDCYVLEDGKRVLTQGAIVKALSGGRREASDLDAYLDRLSSRYGDLSVGAVIPFDLREGGSAFGREAKDLVKICKAYHSALLSGALHPAQEQIARTASAMLAAMAGVGIESMVDEATEYQKQRPPTWIQDLYSKIFRDEKSKWELMFPPSLVKAIERLHGRKWNGGSHPFHMKSTNKKIYRIVLGEAAYAELKRRNPDPHFGSNHHQNLQSEVQAFTHEQIAIIEALARQSKNKREFWARLEFHFKSGKQSDLFPHFVG